MIKYFVVAAALAAIPAPAFAETVKDAALASHNTARAQYGARPLVWNASILPATQTWANACRFQHSNPAGQYGENLYASTKVADDATIVRDAVKAWMDEARYYDYNKPGFSAATGHFTQVVWKSSTGLAVAVGSCPANTIFPRASKYVVARYTPPGNWGGQYAQNVGRPV
ncbi:secretion protein [Herbidospora galbida]|uniref:Secretion protein n=1 Tax=Herbidospora galbida TaxID=2575442 RepID=A0A4V5UYU0_9ACTN|nr:CAP family protein [Herbidospora galbida]TKK85933.1 secretion protein [Herbidospora galbida]